MARCGAPEPTRFVSRAAEGRLHPLLRVVRRGELDGGGALVPSFEGAISLAPNMRIDLSIAFVLKEVVCS